MPEWVFATALAELAQNQSTRVGSRECLPQGKVKVPTLSQRTREGWGNPFAFSYWAGVSGTGGVAGVSAVTSGVATGLIVTGVIFTVARIFSRLLKTRSRSTCLMRPSAEATVVTFSANS